MIRNCSIYINFSKGLSLLCWSEV